MNKIFYIVVSLFIILAGQNQKSIKINNEDLINTRIIKFNKDSSNQQIYSYDTSVFNPINRNQYFNRNLKYIELRKDGYFIANAFDSLTLKFYNQFFDIKNKQIISIIGFYDYDFDDLMEKLFFTYRLNIELLDDSITFLSKSYFEIFDKTHKLIYQSKQYDISIFKPIITSNNKYVCYNISMPIEEDLEKTGYEIIDIINNKILISKMLDKCYVYRPLIIKNLIRIHIVCENTDIYEIIDLDNKTKYIKDFTKENLKRLTGIDTVGFTFSLPNNKIEKLLYRKDFKVEKITICN